MTGDVGPRVIRFGFVGGQNLFKEFPDELGKMVLPGQIAEQMEYWALFRDVKLAALTDEDLDRVLVPLARAIGGDQ